MPKEKHETETKMCDASWFQRNHSVRINIDGAGMSFSVQLKLTVNELSHWSTMYLLLWMYFSFNHCPCCFWSFFVLTTCWHRSRPVLVSPTPITVTALSCFFPDVIMCGWWDVVVQELSLFCQPLLLSRSYPSFTNSFYRGSPVLVLPTLYTVVVLSLLYQLFIPW